MTHSVAIVTDRTFKNGGCHATCGGGQAGSGEMLGRGGFRGEGKCEEAGLHCRNAKSHSIEMSVGFTCVCVWGGSMWKQSVSKKCWHEETGGSGPAFMDKRSQS